jgi:2,3-bisphosphoglycerate-independent phosphoglycerate mutase
MNRLLCLVLDGVGVFPSREGNAWRLAETPCLDGLQSLAEKAESCVLYREIRAHGTAVGLPSDQDMGNSEVGHNAIGAGQIFDQGAKRVDASLQDGSLFRGEVWMEILAQLHRSASTATLHFIGLLSDGNVHSHEKQLYALMRQAARQGVKNIRIHALLDGRDVSANSAEVYIQRLLAVCREVEQQGCNARLASGGGRMHITMDRYEADWEMVARGWATHVLGEADYKLQEPENVIEELRARNPSINSDQYLPSFVMVDGGGVPVGRIQDGDAVVMFNFRGDRAMELCRAFEEEDFDKFDRHRYPRIFFAGMMQYDGDLHIPQKYLVEPPIIQNTLGEYLVDKRIRQFACSETQKFGHVTYFWNGNRSGAFDPEWETYQEIPSDNLPFDQQPAMKAREVTDALCRALENPAYGFYRVNLANGDMVGHSGNLAAAMEAMAVVDECLERILKKCEEKGVIAVVTADHGNCEEMLDAQGKPKTSHTLNPVPLFVVFPNRELRNGFCWDEQHQDAGLSNLANTFLVLMDLSPRDLYMPSLILPIA